MRRVAVVTGAARGIGAACVDALVASGLTVIAVDRCRDDQLLSYGLGTKAQLDAVVGRHGEHAVALVGDVRSDADMALAMDTALDSFGRLDVVVAAAGVVAGGVPADQLADAEAKARLMMDVNYHGVRRAFLAAVPALLETSGGQGRLVAIASTAGLRGLWGLADYAASKHAVLGLVRSMGAELAPRGVTVNAVCPGSTDTAILAATADLYGVAPDELVAGQPVGRLLSPEEPAAAVAWLASPAASGTTGSALVVDGGSTSA
jgi:SDR family mycofactocin-dependent oxidoreductase